MPGLPGPGLRAALCATACLWLSGCQDETVSGYADRDAAYRLVEISGAPFRADASIRFPAKGQVQGRGPCNAFTARQTLPLPWFRVEHLAVTRRACPDLAAEGQFLAALQAMTLAEVRGDTLLLSNDAGEEMVFRAE